MKLATFTQAGGAPLIGVVDSERGTVLPLQALHEASTGAASPHFASMLELIQGGPPALDLARKLIGARGVESHALPLAEVKLLAPVPVPEQIREFSVWEQHMRDAPRMSARIRARLAGREPDPALLNAQLPKVFYTQPPYYHCNRFNVIGPDAEVRLPSYSGHVDYELEIGVFISKTARDIPAERAREHIFGYTIFNDVSAREQMWREMEMRMGPTKGKSWDTANVIGPWIVTTDEIPDVQNLKVAVRINGETVASNTTAGMQHDFEQMIAYISRDETLHAGEFFGSGTVGGCSGLEIDRFLQAGDTMELDVEGIGILRNRVVQAS
jgi:2-keto-4-pentenoate hydratase/2-oxohepta-3-ene-1,7-dioic acid hydratase in catechol pathway